MRILAQHGFGPGDKLLEGIRVGAIAGAVLSPRYLAPTRIRPQIDELTRSGVQCLVDPEFYAAELTTHESPNLGALEEWDYFRYPRRADLISGGAVEETLRRSYATQADLNLREWIAPNVFVRNADSIDTAVAINFIAKAKSVATDFGDAPIFATLALHRDAVLSRRVFLDILDTLTALDTPPDGYYLIVGSSETNSSGSQIRSDLYTPQVISAWMYANYVLSINGARVINGYAHLLSPLLGACGAEASASGWFSGLRKFCLDRYIRQQAGGRYPRIRYVSAPLVANVLQTEYAAYREVVPEVENGLTTDAYYRDREPSRTEAAVQSWDALSSLSGMLGSGDVFNDLAAFGGSLARARRLWEQIRASGFVNEIEPNLERIEAMSAGISLFSELAEIRDPLKRGS